MKRTIIAAATMMLAGLASAQAEQMSEETYWNRAADLFTEYLQMWEDGVFAEQGLLEYLSRAGVEFPNKIRGNNPPGGHYARPPGSEWLKRLQDFNNSEVEGGLGAKCTDIPKLPSGMETFCGFELFWLYSANDLLELDGRVAQIMLAFVCREAPLACEAYER